MLVRVFGVFEVAGVIAIALGSNAFAPQGPARTSVVDGNAPGLEIALRTQDNRTQFHLFEPIPVTVAFRSTLPARYSIELADGWNWQAGNYSFAAEPSTDVLDVLEIPGIVCCHTNRPYLTSVPVLRNHTLTDHIRFARPGTFNVHYATGRVFRGRGPGDPYTTPSGLTVRSNALTLTILPDDPIWDERQLATLIRGLDDPTVASDPRRTVMLRRDLGLLDTTEGIAERVKRIPVEPYEKWKREIDKGYFMDPGGEELFVSSIRPDLAAAAFAERAREPGFAVQPNFLESWTRMVIQRDHPELFASTGERVVNAKRFAEPAVWRSASIEVAGIVRSLLPTKEPHARVVSEWTLRRLQPTDANGRNRTSVR